MTDGVDLAAAYVRWISWRAFLHRGWWLVTSVYLVVDANLSPPELVAIGVGQSVAAVAFEVPAGVVADTISRKWSLIVSHALMGTAMLVTGVVTEFAPLLATQMLWGIAWTFASGAEVAWITDELDRPERIARVLVRSGRAELGGSAAGILGLGALAALLDRSTTIVLVGAAMLVLGFYVLLRFPERRFVPPRSNRWSASWSILVRGSTLVRRSRTILVVFAATFLVNGAANAFGRLQPRRLVDLGLPTDPVAWLAGLGLLTLVVGAGALRVVEARIDGAETPRRAYVLACAAGTLGGVAFAAAPEELSGSAAILLVGGFAVPLTRVIGTIWVNRETSANVRATVHSFLAQAEYVGEIACGVAIAVVARYAGLSAAFVGCGALFALTAVLIQRGTRRPSPPR